MRRGNQPGEGGAKPTLEAQHLQKLAQEASLETAESFAADYIALLPRFTKQIARTAGARDRDLALNASLNLKTKSWLVGALRMKQLRSELELALALADWAAASAVARDIAFHFQRLQNALQTGPYLALRAQQPRTLQTAMAS